MLRMPPVPWRNSVWLDAISLWIRYFLISLKGLLSSSPKRKVKVGDQREQRRLHRIIILNQTKKLFFLIMSSILKQMIMSLILIILLFPFSTCLDTLTLDQSIKDDQSLISKENNFALGFYSPATLAIGILVFGMSKWQNKLSCGLQTGMILSMILLEFSPTTSLETLSSMTVLTVFFGLQMFLSKGQPPLLLSFKIQETWYWPRAITKRCYGKALTILQTLCFQAWGLGWIG